MLSLVRCAALSRDIKQLTPSFLSLSFSLSLAAASGGPLRQRSRPPSLLPLDTASNSRRSSLAPTPASASPSLNQHFRVPSAHSYSYKSSSVLSPPPSSPMSAPAAQIFTSASRSLSPVSLESVLERSFLIELHSTATSTPVLQSIPITRFSTLFVSSSHTFHLQPVHRPNPLLIFAIFCHRE